MRGSIGEMITGAGDSSATGCAPSKSATAGESIGAPHQSNFCGSRNPGLACDEDSDDDGDQLGSGRLCSAAAGVAPLRKLAAATRCHPRAPRRRGGPGLPRPWQHRCVVEQRDPVTLVWSDVGHVNMGKDADDCYASNAWCPIDGASGAAIGTVLPILLIMWFP
jgi:hypothetical protein